MYQIEGSGKDHGSLFLQTCFLIEHKIRKLLKSTAIGDALATPCFESIV